MSQQKAFEPFGGTCRLGHLLIKVHRTAVGACLCNFVSSLKHEPISCLELYDLAISYKCDGRSFIAGAKFVDLMNWFDFFKKKFESFGASNLNFVEKSFETNVPWRQQVATIVQLDSVRARSFHASVFSHRTPFSHFSFISSFRLLLLFIYSDLVAIFSWKTISIFFFRCISSSISCTLSAVMRFIQMIC